MFTFILIFLFISLLPLYRILLLQSITEQKIQELQKIKHDFKDVTSEYKMKEEAQKQLVNNFDIKVIMLCNLYFSFFSFNEILAR